MAHQTALTLVERPSRERHDLSGHNPLISTLTYQSRSSRPPNPADFLTLLTKAKTRNRAVGLTGMLLLNEDRYFQWLEGPSDAVSQVWASIQNDARHSEVELLSRENASQRLFGDWDMKFVCPNHAFSAACDPLSSRLALPKALIEAAAKFALDQRAEALGSGIEDILRMGYDVPSVYSDLIQPAAHLLGDWWMDDRCSDFAITGALCCFQTVARRMAAVHMPVAAFSLSPRRVLIARPPGETHMLGTGLAGDLYRQAGWAVAVDYPTSNDEISENVGHQWLDALTLTASDVFTRVDRMNALAITIRRVRLSSLNPGLVIVVGGRAFAERPDLMAVVGADATYSHLAYAVEKTETCFQTNRGGRSVN
jgi:hypothetical protein